MNAQDLKNSILQLAVQGKLVEQKAEEGTAEELYKQIQEEKQQLIDVGELKKESKLQEIDAGEIPFVLPSNWKWVRLGDVLQIARGGSPRPIKSYITEAKDGVNWIKIGDTQKNSKYINKTKEKIIKEGIKRSRYVQKGDFLLSNSMSFGRPYILNIDGCIHDGWLVLSQLVNIFNENFLFHILSSRFVFSQFSSIVSGAVVKNLNISKVKNTIVPLLPLKEQKRIVAKIEELMPLVEKYGDAHTEVTELNEQFPVEMEKSILQYAIQGKLVEQRPEEGTAEELYAQIQLEKQELVESGKIKKQKKLPEITAEEIPFEIPDSWRWVRLGNLCNYGSNKSVKSNEIPEDAWLLDLEDIEKDTGIIIRKKQKRETRTTSNKNIFEKGNVLYNKLRPYLNKVVIADNDGYTTTEILPLDFGKFVYNKYAQIVLMNPYFIYYTIKCSYGVKMPRLGTKDGKNAVFPLPPLEEQKRIVKRIEELFPYTKQLIK